MSEDREARARAFLDSTPEPVGTIDEVIDQAQRGSKWGDLWGADPNHPPSDSDLHRSDLAKAWEDGFDAGRNHETDAYWNGELGDPVNPYRA